MTEFTTHTLESAPDASKPIIRNVQAKMGFLPNLMAGMSESPVMVESYLTLMGIFDKTNLSETERQIILMTNNRLNDCHYCMAAHTAVSKMAGVDEQALQALRDGSVIANPKFEALRQFTITIYVTRGRPTQAQIDAFLGAGYTKETILEVIVGTSLKVLSNYSTPTVKPPLDSAFEAYAW